MLDILFYIFSAMVLGGALMVVINRNAVNAAMFMIVSLVGVAGLFLLLEAFFLAALQVLVYAGAVVVLFLFIIMLINVDRPLLGRADMLSVVGGGIALALMVLGVYALTFGAGALPEPGLATVAPEPTTEAPMAFSTSVRSYGYGLFTRYMLPLQVTGFLLLAAMVGVILLSKKPKEPVASTAPQTEEGA